MIYTVIVSALAFIATNTDDLFLNMLLYLRSSGKREDAAITTGKFMGTAVLLAVSCFGAAGLQKRAANWLWLLGFIPLGLGIKEIINYKNTDSADDIDVTDTSTSAAGSMLITLASGADNIGIYLPLMAGFAYGQMAVAGVVFFAMTGLFCLVGKQLAHIPAIQSLAHRYRPVLVPAVYIFLGLYIIFV